MLHLDSAIELNTVIVHFYAMDKRAKFIASYLFGNEDYEPIEVLM
jgi:hypothetical protein